VNSRAVLDAETGSAPAVAPEPHVPAAIRRRGFVESWLDAWLDVIALTMVAAGFVIRVVVAARSFWNPDEALHYSLIHQPSVLLAYKASLTNAHPPLLFMVVYFWQFLGRSELMLRMPSVLAGTASCWIAFKWVSKLFGRAAGAISVVLVTFSPCMIALSAELREYAVLLFCIGCALYFLAEAFEQNSARRVWFFTLFLYLAILTHYSAALFVAAAGVYALARIASARPSRKFIAAWTAGQAGALALYAFLYVTHVSKLKSIRTVWESTFEHSMFHRQDGSLLVFTGDNTVKIFEFLFENKYTSFGMLFVFLAGIAVLLVRDSIRRRADSPSRHAGLLLLLPFAAVWGAAVANIYPYSGTRHTVLLAPFMIAAVSFALAAAFGRKLAAGLLIAALLSVASNTSGLTFEPYIKKENQRRELMAAAVTYMKGAIPRSDLIVTDFQSSPLLSYYLCGPGPMVGGLIRGEHFDISCGGYRMVSSATWKFLVENFEPDFQEMAEQYRLAPGQRVWIFQTGWGSNLDTELPWFVPKFRCLTSQSFGQNITVIPFVVGPDRLPALPPGSPHLSSLGLCVK